jgi:hypothetical protein
MSLPHDATDHHCTCSPARSIKDLHHRDSQEQDTIKEVLLRDSAEVGTRTRVIGILSTYCSLVAS